MFASATHHLQPHQFRHPLDSPSHLQDIYNLKSDSVLGALGQGRDVPINLTSPNTFQKPQQYALPIQTPFVSSNQSTPTGSWLPRPDTSEHMLRRKTPNGTLAAGYDGTQVEWTARPHASKHMLMPLSDTAAPFTQQTPAIGGKDSLSSIDPQRGTHEVQYHPWEKNITIPRERHGCDFTFGGDLGRGPWGTTGPLPPSLDSVLQQGPGPQHFYHHGGFQQVPTVLQPMWPPCVGPTASHPQGPYGPYWPNGCYEPYRPAALRDGRFHSQFANFSINDPLDAQPNTQDRATPTNISNHLPRGNRESGRQEQWSTRRFDDQAIESFSFAQNDHTVKKHAPAYSLGGNVNGQIQPPFLEHRNKGIPLGYPTNLLHGVGWSSVPSPGPTIAQSPMENGLPVSNLQFKERVLVWAHRIYLNLLASIQRSRKNNNNNNHNHNKHRSGERQNLQSTIVLKPPLPDLSNDRTLENNNRIDPQRPGVFPPTDYDRTSSPAHFLDHPKPHLKARAVETSDFKWPYSKPGQMYHEHYSRGARLPRHQQLQLNHPLSTVYANPPSPFTPGTFSPTHQRHDPITDARAALEMLARLSQESGWEWTDGILLGGCLAYGLGDYEEALQWYSKVMVCDPKYVFRQS